MSRRKTRFTVTEDGSIIGSDGKILFFSLERFRQDIVEGDCCLICGCSREIREFNDEHIIPDWVLRELKLQHHQIVLPNSFGLQYSKYKIPCCASCNSLLGDSIETPVSKLFKAGYQSVLMHAKCHGPWLFYIWLSLMFLKTHLKDRHLRFALDTRMKHGAIADRYDWNTMHHIHCIVRSFFTRVPLDRKIMGSFFLLPCKIGEQIEPFDFADLFFTKTVLFRFREIVLFCVLDDACAAYSLMKDDLLKRIGGPLSPVQARELMAHMAYAASLVSTPPSFFTEIRNGFPAISVQIPEYLKTKKGSSKRFGAIMHRLCAENLKGFQIDNKDYILKNLKRGKWTFLFDENGEFQKDSTI
jgi:hypothetical protein